MNKKPIFTVGIPAYNAGEYLHLAIKSVLLQDFKDFELIIINDGSTDNTEKIISQFYDERIRIVSDDTNKGLIARLNEMVEMAQGKYFVRMDADDIMFPNRLTAQLDFLNSHPDVALCHSSAVSIDKGNRILGIKEVAFVNDRKDIMAGRMPIHPTVAGKTDFFQQNPYREGFFKMEDKELWYRTIDENKFYSISEPLLFYREDSQPNSAKHKKMYKGLENFIKSHNLDAMASNSILSDSRKKYIAYKIFETLRLEGVLLSKRYKSLENTDYNKVLQYILRQQVKV